MLNKFLKLSFYKLCKHFFFIEKNRYKTTKENEPQLTDYQITRNHKQPTNQPTLFNANQNCFTDEGAQSLPP